MQMHYFCELEASLHQTKRPTLDGDAARAGTSFW
jgi:hypothetical protein